MLTSQLGSANYWLDNASGNHPKRYVQNIFYNLKVFVPLPKFVANSFVQMQEINLIFFFIQPCILKYFFKCLQTEGNKERPWEFTPKIEKKLMFGKQDLQKKNDIFCSGCNCVEISECYPVYIDIYWISHNILGISQILILHT